MGQDVSWAYIGEQAERALAHAREGAAGDAELEARRVLAAIGSAPTRPRAIAFEALAHARLSSGWATEIVEAEELLEQAAATWSALGDTSRHAAAVLTRCREIDLPYARHEQVVARTTDLLGTPRSAEEAFAIRLCRAEAFVAAAEVEAAANDLDVLADTDATAIPADLQVRAALLAAEVAALGGDVADAVAAVRGADRVAASTGDRGMLADVHATAADLLDLAGDRDTAWEHLEEATRLVGPRARLRMVVAELALHARHGDPARAEEAAVALRRFPASRPAESWRLLLLRAAAAHRRRDHRAGRLAARAFEEAAAIGHLELVYAREPEVAAIVHDLAVTAGSSAAATVPRLAPSVRVRALGTFAVERDGEGLELNDQGARIVKLLACSGGRLHVDQLVELLWPDAEPGRGRQRLRNALTRLRRIDDQLVVRHGEQLQFGPTVTVDVRHFDREARRALAAVTAKEPGAVAIARSAIACYGELLPYDRYQSWTDVPRERLRRLYLAVLDLLSRDAQGRGDLDEAVELVELGLEVQPDDEQRYLEAAQLHLARGQRGRAIRLLAGAERLADDLQLPLTAAHRELHDAIRQSAG